MWFGEESRCEQPAHLGDHAVWVPAFAGTTAWTVTRVTPAQTTCSRGDSGTARIEQSCAPKDASYARVQGAMTMKIFAGMMAFAIALISLAILSALALYGDVDIRPGQRNFIRLAPLDAASQSAAKVACVGSLR